MEFCRLIRATAEGETTLYRRSLVGPVKFAIPTRAPVRKPTKARAGNFFTYRFKVTGTCRGCSKGTSLFNDALRQGLLLSAAYNNRGLQGSIGSECFCPRSTERRAPTTQEFTVAFNSTVMILQETGHCPQISSSLGVSWKQVNNR